MKNASLLLTPFLLVGCSAPNQQSQKSASMPAVVVATATPLSAFPATQTPLATPTVDSLAEYRTVFSRSTALVATANARYDAETHSGKNPTSDQEATRQIQTNRDLAAQAEGAAKDALNDLGSVSAPQNLLKADSLLRQALGQYQASMAAQQHYWNTLLTTGQVDQTASDLGGKQMRDANDLLDQSMSEFKRVTGSFSL